ncbi:MAG: D-aminoacyl-tRNA deacylase [Lentihominibacter sp.]|jgi:D-tyrosyl-tRNA(Tyr) deacylase
MRAVVQRVKSSSVAVDGKITGSIQQGLMVLIGVEKEDTEKDCEYIAKKISALRVFDDEDGIMNLSIRETGGEVLAVSQFTLLGDARKGNRPSYFNAADPEKAIRLYNITVEIIRKNGIKVEEGIFQAEMMVEITNDGPVTILLDSHKLF